MGQWLTKVRRVSEAVLEKVVEVAGWTEGGVREAEER